MLSVGSQAISTPSGATKLSADNGVAPQKTPTAGEVRAVPPRIARKQPSEPPQPLAAPHPPAPQTSPSVSTKQPRPVTVAQTNPSPKPVVPGESPLVPSAQEMKELDARVDALHLPRYSASTLRVGQSIVRSYDERNAEREYVITDIADDTVHLRNRNGGTDTMSKAQVLAKLGDKDVALHSGGGLDSPLEKTDAALFRTGAVDAICALKAEKLRAELGDRQFTTFIRLMARRDELRAARAQLTGELDAYRKAYGGVSSMARLGYAIGHISDWGNFRTNVTDAETLTPAPQRVPLARLDAQIADVEQAAKEVRDGHAIATAPTVDPVAAQIYRDSRGDDPQTSRRDVLAMRRRQFEHAVDTGDIADAWMDYHGAVQPLLFQKVGSDSFHHDASGSPSITYAVNQLIQNKVIGDRQLVLSSDDLQRLRPQIAAHWAGVQSLRTSLAGPVLTSAASTPAPLDVGAFNAAFDAEVKRLQRIEADPGFASCQTAIAGINLHVSAMVAAEPGLVRRFGEGFLNVVNSPEFWAAIAIGTATGGVASSALGAYAIEAGGALATARVAYQGIQLGEMAAVGGRFAATAGVNGTAYHFGINAFRAATGRDDDVDMTPTGLAKDIALWSVASLTHAGFRARLALAEPGARGLATMGAAGARYAGENLLGMTAIAAPDMYDDPATAMRVLESNAQMLLAMSIVHGVRTKAFDSAAQLYAKAHSAIGTRQHATLSDSERNAMIAETYTAQSRAVGLAQTTDDASLVASVVGLDIADTPVPAGTPARIERTSPDGRRVTMLKTTGAIELDGRPTTQIAQLGGPTRYIVREKSGRTRLITYADDAVKVDTLPAGAHVTGTNSDGETRVMTVDGNRVTVIGARDGAELTLGGPNGTTMRLGLVDPRHPQQLVFPDDQARFAALTTSGVHAQLLAPSETGEPAWFMADPSGVRHTVIDGKGHVYERTGRAFTDTTGHSVVIDATTQRLRPAAAGEVFGPAISTVTIDGVHYRVQQSDGRVFAFDALNVPRRALDYRDGRFVQAAPANELMTCGDWLLQRTVNGVTDVNERLATGHDGLFVVRRPGEAPRVVRRDGDALHDVDGRVAMDNGQYFVSQGGAGFTTVARIDDVPDTFVVQRAVAENDRGQTGSEPLTVMQFAQGKATPVNLTGLHFASGEPPYVIDAGVPRQVTRHADRLTDVDARLAEAVIQDDRSMGSQSRSALDAARLRFRSLIASSRTEARSAALAERLRFEAQHGGGPLSRYVFGDSLAAMRRAEGAALGDDFLYATAATEGGIGLPATDPLTPMFAPAGSDLRIYVRTPDGGVRSATWNEVYRAFDTRLGPNKAPRRIPHADTTVVEDDAIVAIRNGIHARIPITRPSQSAGGSYATPDELADMLERLPWIAVQRLGHISQMTTRSLGMDAGEFVWGNSSVHLGPKIDSPLDHDNEATLRHEAAGHGTHFALPGLDQMIIQARVLDAGAGAVRSTDAPYGDTNVAESWAVGVEEYVRDPARSWVNRPNFSRLVEHVLSSVQAHETTRELDSLMPILIRAAWTARHERKDR